MEALKRFIKDERGTETVEWAIIIGLIAIGAIALVIAIGGKVTNAFSNLNDGMTGNQFN